jgi:hypothetical protein
LYHSNDNGVCGHATKIDARRVAQQVASSGTLLVASYGMETPLAASDITFNTVYGSFSLLASKKAAEIHLVQFHV